MINTIAETIKERLLECNIFERFGGIAVPFEIAISKTQTIRVPITLGVDGQQCFERGRLFDLAPNTLYRSVFFFEDQTGTVVEKIGPKKNYLAFTGTLRLLGWLHLNKLGNDTGAGYTDRVVGTILAKLAENNWAMEVSDPEFTTGTVTINAARVVRKEPAVFGRYSFSTFQKAFVFPYDFLAIDLTATLLVGQNCFTPVEAETSIDCITEWINEQ
jgi:hypothetical protein